MASVGAGLAAPVLTRREMNLTWSRRWRLHETAPPRRRRRGRMRVYASREWQFRDSAVPAQASISTSSRPDLVGGRARHRDGGHRHRGSRRLYLPKL